MHPSLRFTALLTVAATAALLLPGCIPSGSRECSEAAVAMAQVSDATLANARASQDSRASDAWSEALAATHKWRIKACGQ